MKILYLCSLLIVLIGCRSMESEHCHPFITIVNNSNKTIWTMSYSDSILLHNSGGGFTIKPKEKLKEGNGLTCYESIFDPNWEYGNYKKGVMMYYIVDNNLKKSYSMKEIIEKQMWLKKYDITIEYLQNNNWTIVYTED